MTRSRTLSSCAQRAIFSVAVGGDLTFTQECVEEWQIYATNSSEMSEFVVREFVSEKYSQVSDFIVVFALMKNVSQRRGKIPSRSSRNEGIPRIKTYNYGRTLRSSGLSSAHYLLVSQLDDLSLLSTLPSCGRSWRAGCCAY
ncbi:hypothetical protein DFH11DRAFT_782518 [Phellopilus nigrolimitatus]|nr:hypothetical protein DFH11DRAFT_782518 [Phellopilus nigrolimitatus]